MNALLAAYTGCREPERVPGKSLFFQTWNTLSMETLLEEGSVGHDHAFSSRPIKEAISRLKTLDPHEWRRCRFSLGATTTRLSPREIDLAAAGGLRNRSKEPIRLARFTEKFLLTARGEPERAPQFCPFPGCEQPPPPGSTFYPRLAQPEGAPVPVDNVFTWRYNPGIQVSRSDAPGTLHRAKCHRQRARSSRRGPSGATRGCGPTLLIHLTFQPMRKNRCAASAEKARRVPLLNSPTMQEISDAEDNRRNIARVRIAQARGVYREISGFHPESGSSAV